MFIKTFRFAVLAGLFCSPIVLAQSSVCDEDVYRQFDFWAGDWQVTTADGNVAGQNSITPMLNGCVLHEHYTTPSGFEGNSYNTYDRASQQWHQTWVDNAGLLLTLRGGLNNDSMVLSGPGKTPDGTTVTHRITWTPNPDGSVRQHWQMQKTDEDAWATLFDGTYRRITEPKNN